MTIPRLELAAATVSIRLNKVLKKELEILIDTITFWTDSMTVIRYIENEIKRFHTYVANRVALIREKIPVLPSGDMLIPNLIPLTMRREEFLQSPSFKTTAG